VWACIRIAMIAVLFGSAILLAVVGVMLAGDSKGAWGG